MRTLLLLASTVSTLALVGACASSYQSGSAPGPKASSVSVSPAGRANTVTIKNFTFSALTVRPGATVDVVNRDSTAHTVTDAGGAFDSGTVPAQGTGQFTAPRKPGSYTLRCRFHPAMKGTLVVSASRTAASQTPSAAASTSRGGGNY